MMAAKHFLWLRITLLAAGFLSLLLVYSFTLAPDITWVNDGADGGDLITAAALLGVAHPSGYPTYLLLAHIFQWLSFGTLAARTAQLSAVSVALAVVITAVIAWLTTASSTKHVWIASALAGLAFGLSPLLWSQAVIAEVYGLHIAFTAAILLLLVLAAKGDAQPWQLVLGGLLFGLGMGNHLTLVFLLPPWLWVVGWRNNRLQVRPLLQTLIPFAIGLLVYLYIPLRAATMPAINWGVATTPERLIQLVTGGTYKSLVFGLPPELLPTRIQAWAGLMIAQFTWPGLMLALYGLFFGRTASPVFKPLTVWMVVVYSVFAIGYGTSDSSAYLLPAFLAIALWFAWGTATALQSLPLTYIALRPVLVAIILLVTFFHAFQTLPQVDASRDQGAKDYADAVMDTAPDNAILFTSNDRNTFPLWYSHFALKNRPDLIIVVEPMLTLPWYAESLQATYPSLMLPDGSLTTDEIVATNNRPWCFARHDEPDVLTCTSP